MAAPPPPLRHGCCSSSRALPSGALHLRPPRGSSTPAAAAAARRRGGAPPQPLPPRAGAWNSAPNAVVSAAQAQGSSAARASSRRALAPPLASPLGALAHRARAPPAAGRELRTPGVRLRLASWSRAPLPDLVAGSAWHRCGSVERRPRELHTPRERKRPRRLERGKKRGVREESGLGGERSGTHCSRKLRPSLALQERSWFASDGSHER
jgi:hypothetical protein